MQTEAKKTDRRQRLAKKIKTNLSMTVREIFEQIADDTTRPENMAYFDRIFQNFVNGGADVVQMAGDRKIIGTYCVFVPEELIYAAGAHPVRLCAGAYEPSEIGEELLPDVACPMVKSELGLATMPILDFYQKCDLVALPGSCHWKLKMGELLEGHGPVHMLDVPRIKERESSRRYWLDEVKGFKAAVERTTGNRISRKKLKASIQAIQSAQAEVHRFFDLRKAIPAPILGRDALAVMNAYFYDDVDRWRTALAQLNDELEQRIADGVHVAPASSARILLTGSPIVFPNWKVPMVIEDLGGILVADEFCTSQRYLSDMVAMDEGSLNDMLMAIADRYVLPCSCPMFSNTVERRDKLLKLIDDYQVEGVVYHILKGCHPYDIELKIIEKLMQDKGIPMLKIETDYSPQDVEQLRTRIEAFQETLRGRRRAL